MTREDDAVCAVHHEFQRRLDERWERKIAQDEDAFNRVFRKLDWLIAKQWWMLGGLAVIGGLVALLAVALKH